MNTPEEEMRDAAKKIVQDAPALLDLIDRKIRALDPWYVKAWHRGRALVAAMIPVLVGIVTGLVWAVLMLLLVFIWL
jgi:hypothetical protein